MTTFNKCFITFYVLLVLCQDNVECLRLPAYKQIIYEEYVSVDVTDRERSRRSTRKDVFPEQLTIDFKKTNDDVHLLITRNDKIDVNVPVYHSVTGNKLEIQELPNDEKGTIYQNLENGATFFVDFYDQGTFNLFGSFHIKDEEFYIEPLDIRNTSVDHRIFKTPIAVDVKGDYEIDADVMKSLAEKKSSNFNRVKRTTTDYNVELFIVVDYSIYKFWYDEANPSFTSSEKDTFAKTSIRQFYAFVMSGIDVRYISITTAPFTISVVFAGLYISDSVATSTWTESIKITSTIPNQVDSSNGLSNFKTWISSTSGLPEHDHAMLFTRYDLTRSSSTANAGLAYVSAMCTSSSQSIVEDHFSFALLTVAAHELGHSLGALHDGDGNNACNGNDAFIMAASTSFPTGSTAQNPWKFSSCSVTYFQILVNNLNSGNNNCMATLSANYNASALYPYDQKIPGQVYDIDTQCGYNNGDGSYMCRSIYNGNYTGICNMLWCKEVGSTSCSASMAGDGTLCGNKKWCISGACVESSDAASVLDTCPYGDQPGIILNGLTCAQIASTSPWLCYNVATRCCQSCSTIQTNITNCEYGDRADCSSLTQVPFQCYSSENVCCGTCLPHKDTTIPGCEYGDKLSGCNVNNCPSYSDSVKTNCCKTCYVPPTTTSSSTTTAIETTTPVPFETSTETSTTTHAATETTSTEITTTEAATETTSTEATTTQAATETTTTTEATTTQAATETTSTEATITQAATETTTAEASTTQEARETTTTTEATTTQAATETTSTEATTTQAATETTSTEATTTQAATETTTTTEATTTQAATETTSTEATTTQAATESTTTEAPTTQEARETTTTTEATTTQAATETTSTEITTTEAATETTSTEATTTQAATETTTTTEATTTQAATETTSTEATITQAATETTTAEASTTQEARETTTTTEATTTQAATETTSTEATTTQAATGTTSTEATTTQTATETTTTTEATTTQAATEKTFTEATTTQAATETTSTEATTTQAATESTTTEAPTTQEARETTTTTEATTTQAATETTSTEATTTQAATESITTAVTTTQEASETTGTTEATTTTKAATETTSTEATITQAATETTTAEASTTQTATELTTTEATTTQEATETTTTEASTTQAEIETTTTEASTTQAASESTTTEATTTQAATESTTIEITTTQAAPESTTTEAITTQAATETTTSTARTTTTQATSESTTTEALTTQAALESTTTEATTTQAATESTTTEATTTQAATETTTTTARTTTTQATFESTTTGTTSTSFPTTTNNSEGNPNRNIQDLILITSASGIGAIVLLIIIITVGYLACRNKTDKSTSSFDSIEDLTEASKTYSNGYTRHIRQAHQLPMSESIYMTPGHLYGYDNLGFAQKWHPEYDSRTAYNWPDMNYGGSMHDYSLSPKPR